MDLRFLIDNVLLVSINFNSHVVSYAIICLAFLSSDDPDCLHLNKFAIIQAAIL